MRLNWTSLLSALTSSAVTGTVAAIYGPKAGAVVGAVAFLVQSQMQAVVRSSADERVPIDGGATAGARVQAAIQGGADATAYHGDGAA